MSKLNKIIYLDSAEQFVELYQNGTVTKANGVVVNYNENDLYLVTKKPITVDSELSFDSINPVQNKVIYQKIAEVQSEASNKIDYGSANAYIQWLRSDMITSGEGSGDNITITPVFIGISKNHQDGVQYSSQIFGQASNTSPQSTNTQFFLPNTSGTLATEETTQRKRYRHTILLRDTTQDLTLKFAFKDSKSTAYTASTGIAIAAVLRKWELDSNGDFRIIKNDALQGSGMLSSFISNNGFDIIMFEGNNTTAGHFNISISNETVATLTDTVEEL